MRNDCKDCPGCDRVGGCPADERDCLLDFLKQRVPHIYLEEVKDYAMKFGGSTGKIVAASIDRVLADK